MTDETEFSALASAELHALAEQIRAVADAPPEQQAAELGRLLYDGNIDSLRSIATQARRFALAAVAVEEGGVSAAARRLGMDVGNLSRMIKQLGPRVAARLPLASRGSRQ